MLHIACINDFLGGICEQIVKLCQKWDLPRLSQLPIEACGQVYLFIYFFKNFF